MSSITSHGSIVSLREEWKELLSKLEPGQIVVNNSPNRFGKTYNTLDYISGVTGRYLYLSDRHDQIDEIVLDKAKHWEGFSRLCERKDEPFISALISEGLGASTICRSFCDKKTCSYKAQFQIPKDVVVVAPKEYLVTSYADEHWDMVILDENIEKARKIELTYPELSREILDQYFISMEVYKAIGKIKDGYTGYTSKELLQYSIWAKSDSNCLEMVISDIKKRDKRFKPSPEERSLISYLNNLSMTMEWADYAQKFGLMDHYYKPYLHHAFDIRENYQFPLVILNTSFDPQIYNQITSKYPEPIPEPEVHGFKLYNMDSYLLHYNFLGRSCSKWKITQDSGKKFGGDYGKEIYEMVKRTISFSNRKGLKIGIITYKSLVEEVKLLFGDKVHVISHYGGHQGSNKFDDVDVLINIGTYHLMPKGLYQKHYIINNEYLEDDKATWGGKNNKTINGMQINLTDNENLNKVKLYKLNEEHEQAIFRSGAHIHPGKLVVNFGYVPMGVEEKLNYKKFSHDNVLIALLSRIKDKIGS